MEEARAGHYYAYVLRESLVQPSEPVLPAPERTLGLKYSLRHFYVDDQGNKADPSRWSKQSQEKLMHLQQRPNRIQPGSKNYEEAVLECYLLHRHIANQRRDLLHKEPRRVANAWDAVCVRDDDLDAMTDAPIQAGNVVKETGFGIFREMLRYKLARQGEVFIQVDRCLFTTRSCSAYGLMRDALHVWDCR